MRSRQKLKLADKKPAKKIAFQVEEATIAGVHRALRAKKLTATELVNCYLARIKAYNGLCVRGDTDPATGLQLGDITPIANAGQLNAFITLNLKEDKRIALGFPENSNGLILGTTARNIPTRSIGRASSTVTLPAPASSSARSTASRSRSRTTTIRSICARRRQRRRSTQTIARRTMRPWSRSCAVRERSCSARPTWTSTRPQGSRAAPSAARPAILTIRHGYRADRAAGRRRRLPPTSRCARWHGHLRLGALSLVVLQLVGLVATQGLVSRDGIVPLSFTRDRGGPICRTVEDTAILLEVLAGYDPKDPITAACAARPKIVVYAAHRRRIAARKKAGRAARSHDRSERADRDNVRVANEALAAMKKARRHDRRSGKRRQNHRRSASLFEPGWLKRNFPAAFPDSEKPIDRIVSMAFNHGLIPSGARGVNLRMLTAQPRGNEAHYAINRYLRERGDAKFKDLQDMLAMPMFSGNLDNLKRAFSPDASTLDTQTETDHLLRMETLRRIILQSDGGK